jgi:hypothetical protein
MKLKAKLWGAWFEEDKQKEDEGKDNLWPIK